MNTIGVILCIIALLLSSAAQAGNYRNYPYKFSVELPDGKTVCGHTPPAPDHGVNVLLNTSDCEEQFNVPRIFVYAYYNVPTEASTPEELSDEVCDGRPVQKTKIVKSKTPFYKCLNETKDREITYFALRKYPQGNEAQWMIYQLTNYCDPAGCDAILLERILASLRFH